MRRWAAALRALALLGTAAPSRADIDIGAGFMKQASNLSSYKDLFTNEFVQ